MNFQCTYRFSEDKLFIFWKRVLNVDSLIYDLLRLDYMATKIRDSKLKSEIHNLRQEVSLLRSIVIGILGKDREGKYKPGFVKQILAAAKEEPASGFSDTDSFLRELKKA